MKTLLCFGDSNTHGTLPMLSLDGLSARYERGERWTDRLQKMLPDWQVISEGHPGRTTEHDDPIMGPHRNGMRVLLAILESHRPIDVVLLMLGTNDLKEVFGVTPEQIAQSIKRLLSVIAVSGCGVGEAAPKVLLVAPPPIKEKGALAEVFAGGAAKSLHFGAHFGAVAKLNQVPFIDLAGVVTVSDEDGIHYGPEANPILAEVFAEAITANFG